MFDGFVLTLCFGNWQKVLLMDFWSVFFLVFIPISLFATEMCASWGSRDSSKYSSSFEEVQKNAGFDQINQQKELDFGGVAVSYCFSFKLRLIPTITRPLPVDWLLGNRIAAKKLIFSNFFPFNEHVKLPAYHFPLLQCMLCSAFTIQPGPCWIGNI
jgi:hypothetical protein